MRALGILKELSKVILEIGYEQGGRPAVIAIDGEGSDTADGATILDSDSDGCGQGPGGGREMRTSDTGSWACSACTYENEGPLVLCCSMCSAEKQPETVVLDGADGAGAAKSEATTEAQAAKAEPDAPVPPVESKWEVAQRQGAQNRLKKQLEDLNNQYYQTIPHTYSRKEASSRCIDTQDGVTKAVALVEDLRQLQIAARQRKALEAAAVSSGEQTTKEMQQYAQLGCTIEAVEHKSDEWNMVSRHLVALRP